MMYVIFFYNIKYMSNHFMYVTNKRIPGHIKDYRDKT
jgi:hypothetical protein